MVTRVDGEEDFLKILDFGISKVAAVNRLTKTGVSLGTAAYMAPEQAVSPRDANEQLKIPPSVKWPTECGSSGRS